MNRMKALLAVPILTMAASANAAVYNVTGLLTGWSTPNTAGNAGVTVSYPAGVPTFSGTFDDVTKAYSFHFADFTQHITSVYEAGSSDRTYTGLVYSGFFQSNEIGIQYSSYACVGSSVTCSGLQGENSLSGSILQGVTNGSTTAYTLNTHEFSRITGDAHPPAYFQWDQTFSFTTPASVPIPAAAWLFGSGLLGLAGSARRKAKII